MRAHGLGTAVDALSQATLARQLAEGAILVTAHNPAVDNALVVAIAKMGAETSEPKLLVSSKCCPIAAAPVKTANTPSVDAITDARVLHRCVQRATGVFIAALNRARRSLSMSTTA